MVPSDPIPSLALCGHATAMEHCITKGWARCRFAPRGTFSPFPASTRSSAPQAFASQWDRSLITAFPSPATASAFRGFHSGVNGPGLLFRSLGDPIARPFGFSAPPPDSVSPETCGFPASSPLRVHRTPSCDRLPCLHSPLGFFTSLGIKAFNRRSRHPVRLPDSPDLRWLPVAPSIASLGAGSSFAVRYVSGDLLFLKPLGTNSTMRPFPAPGQWE